MTNLKSIPSIHIHPILLVFVLISFLTGTFVELFIIISIVLFHELGHYYMASLFRWRIKSIMLWVFGGVMDTDEHGTRPLREEALVTMAGPFQHVIIYVVLLLLQTLELLQPSVLELAFHYNSIILLFNLLPIWPLDGGKFLLTGLSMLFPYKKAYHTVIIFSIITSLAFLILQLFLFPFTLSAFFIVLFLVMENRSEWKKRSFVFIRFLLQRYEANTFVKGVRPIIVSHQSSLMDVFSQFRREQKHFIYITYPGKERQLIDESDCLRSYFYYKRYYSTVGELVDSIV
ncbi:site-2 protease family protein [Virgibacillus byunsanensis]|uniref:Site-2 protease family protein n=1 Tax=Virgibacillus byunsanensis TaxID=570945 RepID=A0ABW3LL12_9BACI